MELKVYITVDNSIYLFLSRYVPNRRGLGINCAPVKNVLRLRKTYHVAHSYSGFVIGDASKPGLEGRYSCLDKRKGW